MKSSNDSDVVREFKQYIPIENLVTNQIDRITKYRTMKDLEHFIEAVESLIDLLSPEAEEMVLKYKNENNIVFNISTKGKNDYINLFRFIKRQLVNDNIIWKRSRGYQRGTD